MKPEQLAVMYNLNGDTFYYSRDIDKEREVWQAEIDQLTKERDELEGRLFSEKDFNNHVWLMLFKQGFKIVPTLEQSRNEENWRCNELIVTNERAEKAEARVKELEKRIANGLEYLSRIRMDEYTITQVACAERVLRNDELHPQGDVK